MKKIYLSILLSLSLSTCSTRDNTIKHLKKSKGIINKTCTYIKRITPILIGYEMLKRGVTPVYSQPYSSGYETTQWPTECQKSWYNERYETDSTEAYSNEAEADECCDLLLDIWPTIYPSIKDDDCMPTASPTCKPKPTLKPTKPILDATKTPALDPTLSPTLEPTLTPTLEPTEATSDPSQYPTKDPTVDPTVDPTTDPTSDPTTDPTSDPTTDPTSDPTTDPTSDPTNDPTVDPTTDPTVDLTTDPTLEPTVDPATDPTLEPTVDPTSDPTKDPTIEPTSSLCCACIDERTSPNCPEDVGCQSIICALNPYCCSTEWDNKCAAEANVICTDPPTANPTIEPTTSTTTRRRLLNSKGYYELSKEDYEEAYEECKDKESEEGLEDGKIAGMTLGIIIGSIIAFLIIVGICFKYSIYINSLIQYNDYETTENVRDISETD